MIPLLSQTTFNNQRITDLLPKSILETLIEKTKKGGAEIVGLMKTGSAYYTPGLALSKIAENITNDTNENSKFL